MAVVLTQRPTVVSNGSKGSGVFNEALIDPPTNTPTANAQLSDPDLRSPPSAFSQYFDRQVPNNVADTPPITGFETPLSEFVRGWVNSGGPINRGVVSELRDLLSIFTLDVQQGKSIIQLCNEAESGVLARSAKAPLTVDDRATLEMSVAIVKMVINADNVTLPNPLDVLGLPRAREPLGLRLEQGGLDSSVSDKESGGHPLANLGNVPDNSAA